MATKLYLLDAAPTGTVPTATTSATTPSVNGLATNGWHSTGSSPGSGQVSKSITTLASTASQPSPIVAFCTPPLNAQSIAAQKVDFNGAASESNTNSDFFIAMTITLWRPSTTSVVTRLHDVVSNNTLEAGTTQTALSGAQTAIGASATAQAGDIIVIEIWRTTGVQAMGTAYTNTVYYNGTTDASTTNCATFVNFQLSTLSFQTPAASTAPDPVRIKKFEAVQRASRW